MLRRLLLLVSALILASPQFASAAGRITGRVLDFETSAPVADAQVMLLPVPDGRASLPGPAPMMPAMTRSDAQGAFAFENVAPGRYSVQTSKPGLASVFTPTPDGFITITGDEAVTARDLFLRRGGILTGRVVDTSGEPVAEMMVRVEPVSRDTARAFVPPVQTNDIGEFRLAGAPPGDLYLVVSPRLAMLGPSGPLSAAPANSAAPSKAAGYVTTYYPATADQARATPITIAAGQTLQGLEITMQRGALHAVSGVVVDPAGAPVANAAVVLTGDPGKSGFPGVGGGARASADGTFTITGVQDGAYRLTVMRMTTGGGPGGAGMAINPVLSSDGRPFTVPVTVQGADVPGVRVVVPQE